ncbi:hypothetical protein, partial [Streptomyces lonarensis]
QPRSPADPPAHCGRLRRAVPGLLLPAAVCLSLTAPLAAAPAAAASAAPAAARSQGGEARVTWGVVPANEEGADERVSIRAELEPGEEYRDFVEVTNFSERPVVFALTASDGVVVETGEFDLLPESEEPVGSGAWITIDDEVALEAGSSAVVPFTLRVPDDALPGDHPGGIAVSVRTAGEDDQGNEIALDARVGVRVHLRVAGELAPAVEIADLTAEYRHSWNPFRPGTVEVSWTVANTGNVRLGSAQEVTVTGPFGIGTGATGERAAEQREVLPGQRSREESLTTEAWPLGRLTAEVVGEQGTVGEDVVEAALSEARAEARFLAVPWVHLALLGVLVLLGGGWWWRRRARGRRLAAALAAARAEGAASAGDTRAQEREPGAGGASSGAGSGATGDGTGADTAPATVEPSAR